MIDLKVTTYKYKYAVKYLWVLVVLVLVTCCHGINLLDAFVLLPPGEVHQLRLSSFKEAIQLKRIRWSPNSE